MERLRAKGASSTITDLNSTATRALTGVQMARSVSDMFITKNVTEWESHIEAIDKPDYEIRDHTIHILLPQMFRIF